MILGMERVLCVYALGYLWLGVFVTWTSTQSDQVGRPFVLQ